MKKIFLALTVLVLIVGLIAAGITAYGRVMTEVGISMMVGVTAVAISLFFGTLAGSVAGFYRGKVDNLIMRAMDILLAFPGLLLALGPGFCSELVLLRW